MVHGIVLGMQKKNNTGAATHTVEVMYFINRFSL